MDYLELLKDVPQRLEAMGSSRLRAGLADKPARIEGVADYRRRLTVASSIFLAPWAGEKLAAGGWIERKLLAGATHAGLDKPRTEVFAGGVVFLEGREHNLVSLESPDPMAPRHPNDPAWILDLLYGAVAPVRVVDDDSVVGLHLAARCDFDLADTRCPYGVRRPLGRGADTKWSGYEIEIWCDLEQRPTRINHRLSEPLGRGTFWVSTELWDFGADVQVPSDIPAAAFAN
jgi:hypothetical protein